MRFCKLLLPLLVSSLAFAAQPDRILSRIDSSQGVALTKSLHPKAQPQYDLGAVDPSLKLSYITMLMAPSPAQQKALDQLLAQQQDRKSANYHKWFTPQQFAERFGLSQSDLNKVTAWLKSQGFQILSTGGGRNSVIFSGTAAQVLSAFGAEIHRYEVKGEEHFANSAPIMLPVALSGIVTTVMGLHDFRPQPASGGGRFAAMRNGRPDYYDGNFAFPNFLAPGDIATIYDINTLYNALPTAIDGSGQTLAVVGQTDILLADINDFRNGFQLTPIPTGSGGCTTDANGIIISPCDTTNLKYVLVGTDPHSVGADIGEADLDVEWTGAVARNAKIVYVNAPATASGVNDSLNSAINPPSGPPLAKVISMSYGICEAEASDQEMLLQQGNAEGVTIVNSSGDAGSATCDRNPVESRQPFATGATGGLAVSYPASSPEVTGVGGTAISLANDSYPTPSSFWSTTIGANGGTAQKYIPEIPWQDDEEWAQYCHAPISGDTFCSTGGGTFGWVPLTTAATAAQVQEDIWISQGGGGASNCFTENGSVCTGGFPQPNYQTTLIVPLAPANVRYVPDVSLFASPNFPGYIFCTQGTCASGIFTAVDSFQSLVGGTSVSAPVFAGMVALLNQYLVANGLQSMPGVGNINPTLYELAATPSNTAFNPVTTGDNNVYCSPHTPASQPLAIQCPAAIPPSTQGVFGFSASNFDLPTHYNLVTGLGSVDVGNLFVAWAAATGGTFTLSAAPSTVSAVAGHDSNTTTITVTPANGFIGSVTFSCTGLPTGATCSFSPTSSATSTMLTVQTSANMAAANNVAFTVKGTSGSLSSTTPVSLNLSATDETFTVTPSVTTLSLAPGATTGNTVNFTVTDPGNTGFIVNNGGTLTTALPVTYSCSTTGFPTEASCVFSPSATTSSTALTLTIMTTAPTAQLRPLLGRGGSIFYAMLLPGLFGVVFAAGSGKRGARLLSLIVVLGFSTLWLGACGGSSSSSMKNPGTPAGNYTVTVNGTTGGANPVTASTSFMLTVQ